MNPQKDYDHALHVEIMGLIAMVKNHCEHSLSFCKMYDGDDGETAKAKHLAASLRKAERALMAAKPFDF